MSYTSLNPIRVSFGGAYIAPTTALTLNFTEVIYYESISTQQTVHVASNSSTIFIDPTARKARFKIPVSIQINSKHVRIDHFSSNLAVPLSCAPIRMPHFQNPPLIITYTTEYAAPVGDLLINFLDSIVRNFESSHTQTITLVSGSSTTRVSHEKSQSVVTATLAIAKHASYRNGDSRSAVYVIPIVTASSKTTVYFEPAHNTSNYIVTISNTSKVRLDIKYGPLMPIHVGNYSNHAVTTLRPLSISLILTKNSAIISLGHTLTWAASQRKQTLFSMKPGSSNSYLALSDPQTDSAMVQTTFTRKNTALTEFMQPKVSATPRPKSKPTPMQKTPFYKQREGFGIQ